MLFTFHRGLRLGNGNRPGLQVIVLQDNPLNVFVHGGQEGIPGLRRQGPGGDSTGQQDFDVDLFVRAIDRRRIINKIGIDAPIAAGKIDARPLGQAQIGALADNLYIQLVGVHAKRIIGPVPGVQVAFLGRFDIGSNAAEPQQVGLGLEHVVDNFMRRQFLRIHLQKIAKRLVQFDKLGGPAVDPAAPRDQLWIIIRPAGTRLFKETLSFLETFLRIRAGIEKDVPVVKGGDQFQLP